MANNHGGRRSGAGRKPKYGERTKQIRVPASCVGAVQDMLAEIVTLRKGREAGLDLMRPAPRMTNTALPLFGSSVPAGFPSPADDYIETHLDLNEHFIAHPAATFFARATGDSMNRAGIFSGTILSVDRSLDARHGDIVIAVVNHELTVKRLHRKGGRVELHPESDNPAHQPMKFAAGDELMIWGVVNGIHQKIR